MATRTNLTRSLPTKADLRKREARPQLKVWVQAREIHAAKAAALTRDLQNFWRLLGSGPAEVSLLLCGDAAMRRLNLAALGVDRTTDVLSFPAAPARAATGGRRFGRRRRIASATSRGRALGSDLLNPPRVLGDLVIAVPAALRVARRLGRAPQAELALYAAHGFLHLLGHDHRRPLERRRMAEAERTLLGESGLIGR